MIIMVHNVTTTYYRRTDVYFKEVSLFKIRTKYGFVDGSEYNG